MDFPLRRLAPQRLPEFHDDKKIILEFYDKYNIIDKNLFVQLTTKDVFL